MTPTQTTDTSSGSEQQITLTDNLANIDKIKSMWRAQWPEFSWLTVPGDATSRCYQMFAPDISRVGYGDPVLPNNQCPVWSIMCPQQGVWIQPLGATLNIEVTVTGVYGWATENPMSLDAVMTIQPKIWFSPSTVDSNPIIKGLEELFKLFDIPFPSSKLTAIELNAYGVTPQDQPTSSPNLLIQNGVDPNYPVPSFANHNSYDIYNQLAAHVVYVAVEIGEIVLEKHWLANKFNQLVMKIFNIASGNLLQYKNILSWNVWALAPEVVLTEEWRLHADYWRFSLDVNHRSPEGNGRIPQYFDGTAFIPAADAIVNTLAELKDFLLGEDTFTNAPQTQTIAAQLNDITATHQRNTTVFL